MSEDEETEIYIPNARNIEPSSLPIAPDEWLMQLCKAADMSFLKDKYNEYRKLRDDPDSSFKVITDASRMMQVIETAISARYDEDKYQTFMREATIVAKEDVKPF